MLLKTHFECPSTLTILWKKIKFEKNKKKIKLLVAAIAKS